MDIIELLQHQFFQNALIGAFLASVVCGIIGTYVVIRRLVFISGGITHTSLGGIGIGVFFNLNPILSALVFSIFSAFGIEWLTSRQNIREDSAIGSLWSFGMAIGIIFMYLKPGTTQGLESYLFGNILAITSTDILWLSLLAITLICIFALFKHQILYTAFDEDFAKTRNIPVTFIKYAMMLFIAITIVLSIRIVGIVMLMSILTIPQMTANLFTSNFSKMILLSILINFMSCILGLLASTFLNVPSGASIIFMQVIVFFLCKGMKKIKMIS